MFHRTGRYPLLKPLILGVFVGVLFFAFTLGSYRASGDARFCGSCHSMKTTYSQWGSSQHRQFNCTECHLPARGLAAQVAYKTRAGLNDLIRETARDYPVAIVLSREGRRIINENCVRCHSSTVAETKMAGEEANCLACHRYLVHGRGRQEGGIRVEK